MKKINYSERSNFYDFEVTEDEKIINFLSQISKKLNIRSIINCPCASGTYLKCFSENYDNSIFVDINQEMVDKVNKKILEFGISNVNAQKLDIKKVYELNGNADCIIILNQGIQYISILEFKKVLKKFKFDYIILDLFDFTKGGKLTYFDSSKCNEYYLTREFNINNQIIKRYNRYKINSDKIHFEYIYYIENLKKYETNFELYNYKFDEINKIIQKSNYKLINIYSNYNFKNFLNENGHYILILKRCDNEI